MAELLNETDAVSAGDGARAVHIERLIQEHFGLVWRLLRRTGLAEDRVDAAAEQVFVAAAQRIGDIRRGSERSFLFSAALHVASQARRDHAALSAQAEISPPDETAPALEDLDEQAQARAILDALLGQMTLELRVVFVLHEIEQLTSLDIAEVVGIPVPMVQSRLAQAREDFENHVESSSGLLGSLITAAREEQPPRAALLHTSAALGIRPSGAQSSRSPPSSRRATHGDALDALHPARSGSTLSLVAKWLAVGVAIGLLTTAAVYAVRDAVARSPHPTVSRP